MIFWQIFISWVFTLFLPKNAFMRTQSVLRTYKIKSADFVFSVFVTTFLLLISFLKIHKESFSHASPIFSSLGLSFKLAGSVLIIWSQCGLERK